MSKIIPAFLALSVLALTVLVGISVPGNAADATALPTTIGSRRTFHLRMLPLATRGTRQPAQHSISQ